MPVSSPVVQNTDSLEKELQSLLAECDPTDLNNPRLPIVLNNLAVVHHAMGRFDQAQPLFQQSRAIWQQVLGGSHPRVAQSLNNLAALLRDREVYAEAEKIFQTALAIWNQTGWPPPSDMRTLGPALDRETLAQVPLWADQPRSEGGHYLVNYRDAVQRLKAAVARKDPEALNQLKTTLEKLGPWYHNVDLGLGQATAPSLGDYPLTRWNAIEPLVPRDLSGQSVLDIGCNSGYFLFKMAERGAARLVGIDIMPFELAQGRFIAHWFDPPVELYQMSVYDIAQLRTSFDHVVFVGVLYHLKHPLYALEKVADVCNTTMYMATVIRGAWGDYQTRDDYPVGEVSVFDHPDFPRMYFIEKSYNGDPTNWWFATRSCLKAMLRVSGFSPIADTAVPDVLVCQRNRESGARDIPG